MRTVFVHSWAGETSGGFDWYPRMADAEAAYVRDVGPAHPYGNDRVRVRLVAVPVPAGLTGHAVTEWIDADIDALESELPAVRDLVLNDAKAGE